MKNVPPPDKPEVTRVAHSGIFFPEIYAGQIVIYSSNDEPTPE